MATKKGRIGSSFDSFLKEEGIYEDVTAGAIKRVLASQIMQAMEAKHISKSEMARRMNTSRTQLNRLLDPRHTKIRLDTLYKAATAVGRKIKMELA